MDKRQDLESFLKKVDKISELVKDLNSSDVEVQQKAIETADCYIAALDEPCRTIVNKTTINTKPPLQTSLVKTCTQSHPIFKDKGNEAYAQEDYETAVKYYSDGLAELRDMQPLYTNRAQAYIKLGKYKEAISDCEWALKCNERCCQALKKYKESRNCFEKIVEIEPEMEKMVKEYLTQVDLEEGRESQEMNARQEFDKGEGNDTRVPQLLEKLARPGQIPLYYCGGLEILSQAVTDCTAQTLFRLNNGFSIISSNDTVRSCLLQETTDPDSQELCASALKSWRVICCGNDENQKMLMTFPLTRQSMVHLITSEHVAVQEECLELLNVYSRMPHGRLLAIDNLDVPMLVRNLMACISKPKQQQNTAVNILENFAAENKFCIQLRDVLTDSVILPFTTLLRNISESNRHVLASLISAIGCLARDDVICHSFAHDPECWKAIAVAIVSIITDWSLCIEKYKHLFIELNSDASTWIKKYNTTVYQCGICLLSLQRQCSACEYKEVIYPLLGLIIILSAITSPIIQERAVSLCNCCLGLLRDSDGGVITRATAVLSTVLPQSPEAVQHVIQGGAARVMRLLLKGTGQTATKYAIKTLTVCTAASHLAREELVKSDKKLSILRNLLASSDEMVSGNAALCLAHCLELEGIGSTLLGTDVVLLLLRHAAGDAKRTAVRQNAAIALGKLCRSEPRHMNKLRELHGVEILHSCLKLIT
ncbi:LOW QUALITY PROTEIN: tetratricopeptide repeat protein 12 [Lycodopsis pacificus]